MRLTTASAVAQYAGLVEMLAGDPAAAERELRTGMDELERMGEQGVLASVAASLARAVYEQGRGDDEKHGRQQEDQRAFMGMDLFGPGRGRGWSGHT